MAATGRQRGRLTRHIGLAAAALACWLATGCARPEMERPIRVDGGLIMGEPASPESAVRAFKGVPYAAPPVGELRWRPPQPVPPWADVDESSGFCPACPQPQRAPGTIYGSAPADQDENCLCLNVWTPARTSEERLPVMVWIHGGGLQRGAGSLAVYDGEALARKGVVVVTLNYRLGVLGFLALPELTAESEHHSSGNYGILDQIAALEWVQRNIASFGGDPDRVTIFGESAGSWSVCDLEATPRSSGLFQRAIGESGGVFDAMPSLSGGEGSAEAHGARYAGTLAAGQGADRLEALRALSTRELIAAAEAPGRPGELAFRFMPNVDGWVFPREVAAVFAAGGQHDVPVIVGSNADEGTALTPPDTIPGSVAAYERMAEERFGGRAGAYLALYPASTADEVRQAYLRASGDRMFTWQMRAWARAMARVSSPAYRYLFAHVPPTAAGETLGAYHAAEIAYVFDNLDRLGGDVPAQDRELARVMSSYWVNMASRGDPNGGGLPAWPPYDLATERTLVLEVPVRVEEGVRAAASDFWERLETGREAP